MTLEDAMKVRHKVSKYLDKELPNDIVSKLNERINENNKKYDLNIKLMTDNKDGLPSIVGILMAKGVRNYIILAGPNTQEVDEKLGYVSSDLMLYTQTLGLNTWWIGGMYSRKGVNKNLDNSDSLKTVGIVAVGYGESEGVPHKSKDLKEVSSYDGNMPDWFKNGVEAALLAPTAMNKQAFMINGKDNKVSITCNNGAFSAVDLGICKHHFELGAGVDNFTWE